MRIGELARRAEVSRDTIRFYERHGLIQSDVDMANSYRIYPEDAVLTLDVIRDAQAAGLSIADITVFLGQFLAQGTEASEAIDFLNAKIAEVGTRLESGHRFLKMLEQTKEALARAPQDGVDEMKEVGRANDKIKRD